MTEVPHPSGWAPLRLGVYRALWIAQLGSNLAFWMHTVGAQWLLVDRPDAELLVALVQTALTLPAVLLALPAGAIADIVDRRRLLAIAFGGQVAVTALLAVLTIGDVRDPGVVLAASFVIGCLNAAATPAWMAVMPDLVPRELFRQAALVGNVNVNLARAVGPALAGVLIALAGVGAVFVVNAVSLTVTFVIVLRWRYVHQPTEVPERLMSALRAGGRYVRHSPVFRRVMLRTYLFVAPASGVWALLPVVARDRLDLGSSGYGVLLGALGTGAVSGAFVLARIRSRASENRLLGWSGLTFGGIAVVLAVSGPEVVPLVVVALLPAGFAWLTVFSVTAGAAQLALPAWVRARAMAIWLLVIMLGQALGGLVFGLLAEHFGIRAALLTVAALLVAGVLTLRAWPLLDDSALDRSPSLHWGDPQVALRPTHDEGPVVVICTYTVRPENADAFRAAMVRVGRSRRRTGASRWRLMRDGADLTRFVEIYTTRTWGEHLSQHHGRITATDRDLEEAAFALTEGPAEVLHLFDAAVSAPVGQEVATERPVTTVPGVH